MTAHVSVLNSVICEFGEETLSKIIKRDLSNIIADKIKNELVIKKDVKSLEDSNRTLFTTEIEIKFL